MKTFKIVSIIAGVTCLILSIIQLRITETLAWSCVVLYQIPDIISMFSKRTATTIYCNLTKEQSEFIESKIIEFEKENDLSVV